MERFWQWTKWMAAAALLTALVVCRPAAAKAAGREVVLTAADDFRIVGTLTPADRESPRAGVVLLHMYRHDRRSWAPLVPLLAGRGITALAIDLRGHGDSRRAPDNTDAGRRVLARDPSLFNAMYLDAEAAVRYLVDEAGVKAGRIGLVGASVGCSVAIDTAVRGRVPVAAVVVMTPGRDYLGVPTMKHIERWPGLPLLILSSNEEQERGARPIYRQLRDRGAELRIFAGADIHGTNMFGKVDGVEAMIADWLAARLAGQETR